MPFNLGLLSDASLEGLSDKEKTALQEQATKQFLVGSLLGGDPSMAFRSALSVPADYAARQNQITAMNQLAATGRARNASMVPTTMGVTPGSEQSAMLAQDVADFGPDAIRTAQALYSNPNLPRELNKTLYAKNVAQVLAGTDPTKWAEFEKNVRPQAMEPGSVITDPFNPTKILSQLPGGIEKGMQWGVNATTGKPEIQLMPGFAEATGQRISAEEAAKAGFVFEKVKDPNTGATYYVSKKQMAGGQVAPTTPPVATQPAQPPASVKPQAGNQTTPPQIPGFVPGVDIAPRQNPLVSQFMAEQSTPEADFQSSWKQVKDDAYKGWKTASDRSSTLQSLQNIMNKPDFDTNAFSNYKSQLAGVLNASGIATEQQKQFLNNATSFRQALNTIAAQNVTDLSGSTSNFDLEFSQGRFATIKDTKQANQYAIDLLAASDARKRDFYNFVNSNRTPDVAQKWMESEKGKASLFESPTMRKYLPSSTVTDGPYKGQTAYRMPDGTVKVFPK